MKIDISEKDNLIRLGYTDFFQPSDGSEETSSQDIARVNAVHKSGYVISKGYGDEVAELAGKFIHSVNSSIDFPTVGDWVCADFYDGDTHAVIHRVVPRKTLIKRKTAGKNINYQLIAANIDVAFIVQSLNMDFSLRRLERYLVMINESNIVPIVLLSKCDLMSEDDIADKMAVIVNMMPDLTVIPFSNETGASLDKIQSLLHAGKTYCLVGSSGVGKTTLLNHLMGGGQLETKPVREKDNKGRHTTTHRQLIQLESGALVIDTPGMRELGNMSVDMSTDETFSEIVDLITQCKFKNCSHVNEKGCAVLSAIKNGTLSEKRFRSYEAIKQESTFNEMSYYERRHKNKQFGKVIKSAQHHRKKNKNEQR